MKKLRKSITAAIAIGVLTVSMTYTQTDVVSGFGSFSHGCKVEY